MKTGFQRLFLIFANEDAGYEAGQKPSGYVKLEMRDGVGRLYALAENLRPGNGRFEYWLYLLRTGREGVAAVCAGKLVPGKNKAELKWNFDFRNVGASGFSIDEFDIATVIAEYIDRPDGTVICPLAAYRGKKAEWRSGFRVALQNRRLKLTTVADKICESAADGFVSQDEERIGVGKGPDVGKESAGFGDISYSEETAGGLKVKKFEKTEVETEKDGAEDEMGAEEIGAAWGTKATEATETTEAPGWVEESAEKAEETEAEWEAEEIAEEGRAEKETKAIKSEGEAKEREAAEVPGETEEEVVETAETKVTEAENDRSGQGAGEFAADVGVGKSEAPSNKIDTNCIYLNGNICGAFVNNSGALNPCESCRTHYMQEPSPASPVGDIAQLRTELDRYFEVSDPFHSKRSDYSWWKVHNPVNLNNLLYQCNIRSPLLFNPVVMMAHYKYRHLIIGIFQHKSNQKQYVVCGVPGMYMVDTKPFGEMSRWVQAEGNRLRYGAFGYWLVYINPEDGKMLSVSQE